MNPVVVFWVQLSIGAASFLTYCGCIAVEYYARAKGLPLSVQTDLATLKTFSFSTFTGLVMYVLGQKGGSPPVNPPQIKGE